MSKFLVLSTFIIAAANLAGCSSENAGTEGPLTHDEATAIVSGLTEVNTTALNDAGAYDDQSRLASTRTQGSSSGTIDLNVDDFPVSCENSGSVTVDIDGESAWEVGDESLNFDVNAVTTLDLTDCSITTEDGEELTISGTINVEGTIGLDLQQASETSASATGSGNHTVTGTVSVVGDEVNEPACEVDFTKNTDFSGTVQFDADEADIDLTVSWDGTICGGSTSGNVSLSSN